MVVDQSHTLSQEDLFLIEKIKDRQVVVILNKNDLPSQIDLKEIQRLLPGKKFVRVSALQKTAIEELENTIVGEVVGAKELDSHGIFISNLRHIQALKEAYQLLGHAHTNIREGLSIEFISEEIKLAVNTLDSITGRNIDNDLLDQIFSAFCIGK